MNLLKNFIFKLYSIKMLRKLIIKLVIKIEGGQDKSNLLRLIFEKYHGVKVGLFTYGGIFNPNIMHRNIEIGKYCSIAPNVYFFDANHPKEYVTTHPILYNPIYGYTKVDNLKRTKLVIGNDVWIGQNAIILPSVKYIGDGAIIGAGTIVTKDVPDYSIVVGNPGKIISKRFDDETIIFLKNIKWWDWDHDKVLNSLVNMYDINKFKRFCSDKIK